MAIGLPNATRALGRVEESPLGPPLLFRLIHRDIGPTEQLGRVIARLPEHNTDARAAADQVAIQPDRLIERVKYTIRHLREVLIPVNRLNQHREFIAAEACGEFPRANGGKKPERTGKAKK